MGKALNCEQKDIVFEVYLAGVSQLKAAVEDWPGSRFYIKVKKVKPARH